MPQLPINNEQLEWPRLKVTNALAVECSNVSFNYTGLRTNRGLTCSLRAMFKNEGLSARVRKDRS